MVRELLIDPEFEAKCFPITEQEFRILEKNIVEEGVVLMPIIVWNNTIIDGHNRYKICRKHPEIPFYVMEKNFGCRDEAIVWICNNQLGRRNLTPQQRKYLIGVRYAAEKRARSSNPCCCKCQPIEDGERRSPHSTRAQIARETNTNESFVKRANEYARGVNAAEAVLPGIKDELLSGAIKPCHAEVAAIAKTDVSQRRKQAEQLRVPKEKGSSGRVVTKHTKRTYQEIEEMYEEKPVQHLVSYVENIRLSALNLLHACSDLIGDCPYRLSDMEFEELFSMLQDTKEVIEKMFQPYKERIAHER